MMITSGKKKNKVTSQNGWMIRQLNVRLKRKLVENPRVLKTTSKNMAKQLKMRQKI